jgi:hypothetical protein
VSLSPLEHAESRFCDEWCEDLFEGEQILRLAALLKEREEAAERCAGSSPPADASPTASRTPAIDIWSCDQHLVRTDPRLTAWLPAIQARASAVKVLERRLEVAQLERDHEGAEALARALRTATVELARAKCEPATGVANFATPVCLDDDLPRDHRGVCPFCLAP